MVKKLTENILDKFSMNFLKDQVLKNAYGNNDTVIAALDPRILIVWYLFFGLVPWFVDDLWFLGACFALVVITTLLAHIVGLVLFVFALGVFSQTGYLFIVSLFFGGDASAIVPLLILTLKVATCSLASITVFSGLDPDRLANGLMWFGVPERLSFSISYAYRILPMLMEEFQNILLSFRMRGMEPEHDTFMGKIRYDHAGILSIDAQYSKAFTHNSRSFGNQGLPQCGSEQGGQKDQAFFPACHIQCWFVSGFVIVMGDFLCDHRDIDIGVVR